MNTRFLGLDCSSTTVGYCVIDVVGNNIKLVKLGYIKPPKIGTIFYRLKSVQHSIIEICDKYRPNKIAIEEIAKFFPGKSTATTIITLAVFNRVIGLTILDYLKIEPDLYSVMAVRHGLKKSKELPAKEDLPKLIEDLTGIKIPILLKKTGTIKPETYDQSDAAALAIYAAFKHTNQLEQIKKNRV